MSARRKASDGPRLLSFWEPPDAAGPAVGCIATTFTFDAPFFEEHCLGRFVGMDTDPNEDQRGYLIEREERLSQVFAHVLVDRSHVTAHRSLRWSLCPVTVPRGGILHAKVSLLVWEKHVRVLIASANLTEPGYRRNFEQVAVLDFTPEGEVPLGLLRDVLAFLEHTRSFAAGVDDQAASGSRGALGVSIRRVKKQIADWQDTGWVKGEPRAELLTVLPGSPSLIRQLMDRAWTGTGPDEVHVMSPFFDLGDGALRTVGALHDAMGVLGERLLLFFASGRRLPNGFVELDVPEVLRDSNRKGIEHKFNLVHAKDAAGESRDLHAKSLWMSRTDRAVCTVGSSNFTAQGMGVGAGGVNIEANLAFVMSPSVNAAFWNGVAASWPPDDELDVHSDKVQLLSEPIDRTPEHPEFDPLPASFGEALFDPRPGGSQIILQFASAPPADVRVESLTGRLVVEASELREATADGPVVRPWPEERPPSGLLVRWTGEDEQPRRAVWVVNVTDPGRLAPPSELSNLTLEELIEVLTSARPLHVSMSAIFKRRDAAVKSPNSPVLDPHKKVDTRNFLLRRVRLVSRALEGMRERLERPAFTTDALVWRLHGPVGPLALARRLAENEGQGAAFMIAEVALTVRHAELGALEASLGREYVRRAVGDVLEQLESMAAGHPSPSNLSRYVQDCFEAART